MSDLLIEFSYAAGTMPPPHHYSYTLNIDINGRGLIEYIPDYDFDGVPVWSYSFVLADESLAAVKNGVETILKITDRIKRVEKRTVGGSLKSAVIYSEQGVIKIQSDIESNPVVDEFYSSIKGAIPDEINERIKADRENYIKERYNK